MNPAKSVLLAEDDVHIAEFVRLALTAADPAIHLVRVKDGAEALDYLHARGPYQGRKPGDPSLVLLDLAMPKIGGWQVLQEMKTDRKLKVIPVIVLTFSRNERDVAKCYQLGANGYVVKPPDFQQFITAIKGLGLFWLTINEAPPQQAARIGALPAATLPAV